MAFASRKRRRHEVEQESPFRSAFKLSRGSLVFRTDASTLDQENPELAWRLFLTIKTAQQHAHASEEKCASGDDLRQSATPTPPDVFQNFLRRSATPTPLSTFRFTPHSDAEQRQPQPQQRERRRRRVMEYQSMRPLLLFVLSRDDHLRGDPRVLQEWASQGGFDGCISDPAALDAALVTLFDPLAAVKLIDDNKRRGVSQTLISDMFTRLSMRKGGRTSALHQQQQRRELYSDVEQKQAGSSLQSHTSLPATSGSSLFSSPATSGSSVFSTPATSGSSLFSSRATSGSSVFSTPATSSASMFSTPATHPFHSLPHAPASAPINHSSLQSQQTLMRSFFSGGLPQAKLLPEQHASAGDGMDCSHV